MPQNVPKADNKETAQILASICENYCHKTQFRIDSYFWICICFNLQKIKRLE